MGKYVFQTGGAAPDADGSDFFNQYVDQLSSMEEPTVPMENNMAQEEIPEEQESEYIQGLRAMDEENSKVDQAELFESKLTQMMEAVDQKLAEFGQQTQEFDWFADMEGSEALTQQYDTQSHAQMEEDQIAAGQEAQTNGSWPPPTAPMFTSSGDQGMKNIGPEGLQIGNDIAQMLGYQPEYNSIYRTRAQQDKLIAQGKPAVKNSRHLQGNAVDVNPRDWKRLTSNQQSAIKQKYKVIYHDNHYHVQTK